MAQHGDQYGRRTDEYGEPVHRPAGVDYGTTEGTYGTTGTHQTDPLHGATGTTGAYQTDPYKTTGTTGAYETGPHTTIGAAAGGQHRRSGSSSSSSSEDDGFGGRRKKGLKEKIKEKLPGSTTGRAHEDDPLHYPPAACEPEKKGTMETIKEKLPGHHHGK